MRLFVFTLGLASLLAGCPSGGPPKADPPRTSDPELAGHMTDHFLRVVAVRDAVARGDFAATREPARWLTENGASANVPDEWAPMVAKLRDASLHLDQAKKLEDVARALGPVIESCGACHQELAVTLSPPADVNAAAPTGDTFDERMARHVWALEQMWFGLVAPSSEAWTRGATVVAADNLHPPKGPAMPSDAEELEAIADKLKALGASASSATSSSERAAVYGEMLLTCVTCHQLSGRDD